MKGFSLLLLGSLFFGASLRAENAPVSLPEAFDAYARVRHHEEKSRIADRRHDLEEGARLELSHKLATELEAARVSYRNIAGSGALGSWERAVLRKVHDAKSGDSVNKQGLAFLNRAFGAKAKAWSPLEWQVSAEWFGKATEDAFLRQTFSLEEVPADAPQADRAPNVVWVADPLFRYLAHDQAARQNAEKAKVKNDLEKHGYQIEDMEIAAFTRLDEQAEDLHLALVRRVDEGVPFTLVSAGYASAVLLRTLDLNPGLLRNPVIRGWLNVNGQLFGDDGTISRGPASASKADKQLHDVRHELLLLREERLEPQTPLAATFPIFNVVTLSGSHRPGASLRDSLLPDARTLFLPTEDGLTALQRALPAIGDRKPSGQRDMERGERAR